MDKLLAAVLAVALILPIGAYAASFSVLDLEVTDVALSKSSFNMCEPLTITATVKENYNPLIATGPTTPIARATATPAKTGPTAVIPEYKVTFYYYRDLAPAAAPQGVSIGATPTIKQTTPVFDITSILRWPVIGRILQPFVTMPTASTELIIKELPAKSDTGETVVKIGEATVAQHIIGETGTRTVTYKYWATPEYDNYVIGAYVDLANADSETNNGRKNNKVEKGLIQVQNYKNNDFYGVVSDTSHATYTASAPDGANYRFDVYTEGGEDDSNVNIVIKNMDTLYLIPPNKSALTTYLPGDYSGKYITYEPGGVGAFATKVTLEARHCEYGIITDTHPLTFNGYSYYAVGGWGGASKYSLIEIRDSDGKKVNTVQVNDNELMCLMVPKAELFIKNTNVIYAPKFNTIDANIGFTYGDYTIYATSGLNNQWSTIVIKDATGAVADTLKKIYDKSWASSDKTGLTIYNSLTRALQDGTIQGTDIKAAQTGTIDFNIYLKTVVESDFYACTYVTSKNLMLMAPNVEASNNGAVTSAQVFMHAPQWKLHIASPNGGETYFKDVPIEWCVESGGAGNIGVNIGWISTDPNVINAYGHDPAQVKYVSESIKNGPQKPYNWDGKGITAPFKGIRVPDGKYKIFITDTDNYGMEDESDSDFTISLLNANLGGNAGQAGGKLNAPQGGTELTPTSVSRPNIRNVGSQPDVPSIYPDFEMTFGPMAFFTKSSNGDIIPNITWGTNLKSSSIIKYGLLTGDECADSDLTDTYSDAQKIYTSHVVYLSAVTEDSKYCYQVISQTDEQTDNGITYLESDILLAVAKPLYAPAPPTTPKIEAQTFTTTQRTFLNDIADFFGGLFGSKLPDLTVSDIKVVQTDHINTITITVSNTGNADAYIGPGVIRNKIPWLCWQIESQCMPSQTYPNSCAGIGGECKGVSTTIGSAHCVCQKSDGGFTLKAGSSKDLIYVVKAPTTASDITVEIDPDNTIKETTRANNVLIHSIAP